MKINDLAILVAHKEGLKKPISIAQVKEVLACIQKVCKEKDMDFYAWIRRVNG